MSANIGWLFYKDYFQGIDYHTPDATKNEQIIKEKADNIVRQKPDIQEETILGNIFFEAKTTYPGLLLGSGNAHELPSLKEQLILGFDFDYTSGLPVIRGSSLKGLLRSAFAHQEYIEEILQNPEIDIAVLEEEIFEYGDLFFDARPIKYSNAFLQDDYITPHGENPLKNPTPLHFVKVAPGVTFRFEFTLYDTQITKEQKVKLFAKILDDLGIGAKTNVGYGKFEPISANLQRHLQAQEEQKQKELLLAKQQQEQEEKEKALSQITSIVERVKVLTKDLTKADTKEIYVVVEETTLSATEKKELFLYFEEKIGPKPAPKNKASVKWARKLYELLES
ncbi:type III-B CRISPR module RAMP protein Cmr6 [Sulfurimonas sp. SWIR-19]|uniref:type III-B CRISPR module RAMP protein Cmr6 n=1 Tax=Sulfurimonas sp. SWIR-19 TaxID=2878390 RepID=UPI001CF3F9CE|nr:type III-B CRISPR module RAMP protein Cmr6 [Sulfurimonas sp. SWIR-19]UCN01257.1 type III-B CRISPR module RAMP protein Cmr6 [Sulfurimonas sp. SWIR-19]